MTVAPRLVVEGLVLLDVLQLLDAKMQRPQPYGLFHLAWVVGALTLVFLLKNKSGERATRRILATFGILALVLEALKQFSWSFSHNELGQLVFAYQWYAAPFQLCTAPAYVAALYPFVKSARLRGALRGFLAYFTLLASVSVALLPNSIYTEQVLINVHTSFLHMGGLFVSLWLLLSGRVSGKRDFWGGYWVFLGFVGLAMLLNIGVYHLFDLKGGGAIFDMFFISPYYPSSLPVFSTLDQALPLPLFLLAYLLAFLLGGALIAWLQVAVGRLANRAND